MKKLLLFVGTFAAGIGIANAAVRDASTVNRQSATATQSTTARTATTASARAGTITSRGTASPTRAATISARSATTGRATKTSATIQTTTARSATAPSNARMARSGTTDTSSTSVSRAARTPARAVTLTTSTSNTFGTGYTACRDAYFTCMDQFCAKQNDAYRRCVCSSRLADIQSRERTLAQTSTQLQDFKDLNIDVIPKTSNEVKAMLNATAGETIAATVKDKSDSAQKLAGISEVLSSTKSKALSTQGTLDIAGDINAIWATTDLAGGAQIANLTGEPLYNAVHSQCVEIIADKCATTATLNMVVSAYGMYIENDCTALSNALDKKVTAANAAIRETESEMHAARLENYDAHNSTAINECIAQVRRDITADTACGANYVHCLDVSGKYLNRDTGEPIYTADFYQLESAISLNGDILTNQANRLIVNELNHKRSFAERGLETCRDLADDVWNEFMRQAITEIYQGQHERIRKVKNECLDVVNQCYDSQSKSLKDFSNVKEQLLLGSRLELSESMCREKLDACSNLYGGGTDGLQELLATMKTVTDQKIAQACQTTLLDYAKEMCAVPSNDSLHSYPFGCRTYAPGSQYYAAMCHISDTGNNDKINPDNERGDDKKPLKVPTAQTSSTPTPTAQSGYSCPSQKKYTSCAVGYYMTLTSAADDTAFNNQQEQAGNSCKPCSVISEINNAECECPGGTEEPICNYNASSCGDYDGSLYQKLVRYAQQTCVRPSESTNALPSNILQDVNVVMDAIRIDMARELAKECERFGGIWIDTPSGGNKLPKFYSETSASEGWGHCQKGTDTTSTATSESATQ